MSFDYNNDSSLEPPKIVLREHLGDLALAMVSSKKDFPELNETEAMIEFYKTIKQMHEIYDNSAFWNVANQESHPK